MDLVDRNTVPLSRSPVLRSSDPDEAQVFIANKRLGFDVDRLGDGGLFDARINAVYLPSLYLSGIAYGAAVSITAPASRADYGLQIPLRGGLEARTGRQSVISGRGVAAIGSPGQDQTTWSSVDCTRLTLTLSRDALVRHLSAFLGIAVEAPLVFEPAMDLETGAAQSLLGCLRWTVGEMERDGSVFASPLAAGQIEQLMMTALLLAQPSNYSRMLEGPDPMVAPRDVKRTVDYIHANAALPLRMADLVAVSGVAGRTLYKHFRAFTGMSPMAYLRKVRFEQARDELLRSGGGLRISELALRCGLDHFGRFSVEYRRRFGESPSQTAARGGARR